MAFWDGRLNGGFAKADEVVRGGPMVVIYAVNLEALQATVVTAGAPITKEIVSFPGGRRFQFSDSNGNEFAVWSDQEPAS
jgi:predicted enzyme related to lactoylglutathione lyase